MKEFSLDFVYYQKIKGMLVMWDKVRIHYWHIAKMNESLTTKGMKHQ